MDRFLRHEKLIAYQVALAVAQQVRSARFPRGDADLKDQARRSAQSVCLNLAEGTLRQGKDRLHHFRIAAGSAAELCAVLDLVDIEGRDELQRSLRRVVALISGLR